MITRMKEGDGWSQLEEHCDCIVRDIHLRELSKLSEEAVVCPEISFWEVFRGRG